MTPGCACLLVRSHLTDAGLRDEFDRWYRHHHLPFVVRELGARRGWRYWSASDPCVHVALYEFDDLPTLERRMAGDEARTVIADYDATWGDRVSRTRELLELVDPPAR